MLFPFVLDGGLDARRLDPFSGENRTMKANLLYRGQDAEHGYVWMEFGRPAEPTNPAGPADATEPGAQQETEQQETVTLVIGLTAHKNWERARPSFFITGQRMGIDFGLLSADSRPLTAKQLTAILGRDASFGDRRGAYQDAVDARLFGLGRERYTQLLDLLIALRRPLLAKDLDPVKVSDTLSAGLSPVDDDLVEQAARDFENLAAVQKQYDDLAAADAAVRAFLTQYTAYLRAHTRHQADQVTARMTAAAGHVGAIITAVHEAAAAGRQEQRAKEAGESAQISVDTFGARLSALKDRDAYKDHEKLALRRSQLEAGQGPAGPGSAAAGLGPGQRRQPAAGGRRRGQPPRRAGPRPRPAPAGAGRVGGRRGPAPRRRARGHRRRPGHDGQGPGHRPPRRHRRGPPPARLGAASPSRPANSPRPNWARPGRPSTTATRPAGTRSRNWPPPARTWPGNCAAGPPGGPATSPRRSSTSPAWTR